MLTLAQMKTFVREASDLLAREHDLAAFEVYCASAEHRVARLNYTSDIPCRGVEEFKAINADGFALRIVTRRDAQETGYAPRRATSVSIRYATRSHGRDAP